ncbi:MAG: nucleoside-diphosphate sugar epimerase/dehydratase [Eubacteriales bacterium]|nr:nucleoside-diphosphate sugar epimerase/dehydratase [Eubacteriales bacterium]
MNSEYKKKKLGLEHWQWISVLLMIYDAIAVNAAFYAALWLRYDCHFLDIPFFYLHAFSIMAPFYSVACFLVFKHFHLYNTIWRFAGLNELLLIFKATAVTFVIQVAGTCIIPLFLDAQEYMPRMPITYYVIGIILQFLAVAGIRFSFRVFLSVKKRNGSGGKAVKNVMLIGAGAAGQMILRDLNNTHAETDRICCIIDDNPNKWNRFMEGVPVAGGRNDIFSCVEKFGIDKIIFAIPSAPADQKREILNICSETECELKQVTVMYQQMGQVVNAASIKDVAIEDLLGRDTIKVDMEEVFRFISGQVILVTGGGGSIGSELCRQIAAHKPKTLIIFDIYENNAYDIQLELMERYPQLDLVTLIGSVRDSRRLDSVFEKYRPEIVFHAAAHKHVPLMEDSPCESIKNNVLGTYKTAYAAMMHGCARFVLISTDKAVNPTNVMGASKRLCEMVIQSFDRKIKAGETDKIRPLSIHAAKLSECSAPPQMELVALRFGNVLGSNGSVVPLFKKQIAKGGPVTVTHPDIIRYFMTVPEAVSLVLQAGTYAKGGEIFVFDMGQPVKIDTLARNLIKLSGLRPDIDIKIEYSGLRPGEKLYEEKLMSDEGLEKTANDLIFIGHPVDFDSDVFLERIDELAEAAYANREDIRELIMSLVPTYAPKNFDNKKEKEAVSC